MMEPLLNMLQERMWSKQYSKYVIFTYNLDLYVMQCKHITKRDVIHRWNLYAIFLL